MATRSNIAMKTTTGKIVSVYCHWDGYVANNGKILLENYTDIDKIEALVALGSISSLGEQIGDKQDFMDRDTQKDEWTLFYSRDRGEELSIQEYASIPDWIDDMEEYAYLWNGQEWLVNDHGEKDERGFPIFDLLSTLVPIELEAMRKRILDSQNS
tara:strand:+ start:345 stop:812 length:468 start_codon:yes stop_codon:yes gene_type:complete